ncbi:MAG: DUF4595 domain-containing protein [Muribaculaceae bacterium]|nr:DUF4595 domain-containing protein [Muribaculaceae bacterium]
MGKMRFVGLAVAAVLCAGFASCSDDDDKEPDSSAAGGNSSVTENVKQNLSEVFPKGVPAQVGDDAIEVDANGLVAGINSDGNIITFNYKDDSGRGYDVVMDIDNESVCCLRLNSSGFVEYCLQEKTDEYDEYGEREIEEWWFEYNSSGQITKMKRTEGGNEIFTITYTNWNIGRVEMTSDDPDEFDVSVISYGESPIENSCGIMLFDECFGIDMDEMKYAYYAGLLGKATRHLPVRNNDTYNVDVFDWTLDSEGRPTSMNNGQETVYFSWDDSSSTSPDVDEYGITMSQEVDLGLSVNWAGWNVGATRPEEYGGYYAWGETEEKSNYEWFTYKWYNGEEAYNAIVSKYCVDSTFGVIDNRTVLEPEDDVAHVKWGEGWRMPTSIEQEELMNNCTWAWITVNGVDGYKVTSKSNGNSIFLPAAGYIDGSSLDYTGFYGCYQSSSLSVYYSLCSCFLRFYSGFNIIYNDFRYYGRSVRPVKEK